MLSPLPDLLLLPAPILALSRDPAGGPLATAAVQPDPAKVELLKTDPDLAFILEAPSTTPTQ